SVDAGELIGKLYNLLSQQYVDPESEAAQHSLNVLCVRLVFCLFAEDAGVFEKWALYYYLSDIPARQVRIALRELFDYLDTTSADRDPYASYQLNPFSYFNAFLFSYHNLAIP